MIRDVSGTAIDEVLCFYIAVEAVESVESVGYAGYAVRGFQWNELRD